MTTHDRSSDRVCGIGFARLLALLLMTLASGPGCTTMLLWDWAAPTLRNVDVVDVQYGVADRPDRLIVGYFRHGSFFTTSERAFVGIPLDSDGTVPPELTVPELEGLAYLEASQLVWAEPPEVPKLTLSMPEDERRARRLLRRLSPAAVVKPAASPRPLTGVHVVSLPSRGENARWIVMAYWLPADQPMQPDHRRRPTTQEWAELEATLQEDLATRPARYVMVPARTGLPPGERLRRGATAALATPLTLAADIVTSPLQLWFFIDSAAR